jgi:RNase H-fold protein (predicted Holliday junction resolvase)
MTKKNLNNQLVLQELIEHFDWKNKNQTEQYEETFEYEINFNLCKEENGEYTMVCEVLVDGAFNYSFPIGWKYTERGVKRKADQLLKMIESSRPLEVAVGNKNKIKSWGWTVIDMAEVVANLNAMDEEEEQLSDEQKKIIEALEKEGYRDLEFNGYYERVNYFVAETDDTIEVKIISDNGKLQVYDRYLEDEAWTYQLNLSVD